MLQQLKPSTALQPSRPNPACTKLNASNRHELGQAVMEVIVSAANAMSSNELHAALTEVQLELGKQEDAALIRDVAAKVRCVMEKCL